jgi:Shedu protein SduA, C-terminal
LRILSKELDELEVLLLGNRQLHERNEITPFFKNRRHLSAALGLTNSNIELPDRVATELNLFGDFACDVACGDSVTNAYTLVEFEDAHQYSILSRLETGKIVKRWAPRFEHGFSQLVDWAWRLSTEGASTQAYRRLFGANDATVHLLLIVGRDADLTTDDLARLRSCEQRFRRESPHVMFDI